MRNFPSTSGRRTRRRCVSAIPSPFRKGLSCLSFCWRSGRWRRGHPRRPAVSPGVQAPHDPYPRRGPGAHLLGEGDHSAQGGLPHQRRFPARYSRHYYDLWCMDKSPVKTAACGDLALLDRVYGSRTGSIHRVRPTMSWQNRARCDCFRRRSASLFCGRIMSIWKNMIFSSRRLWNVWRGWRGRSMGCEESSRL